MTCNFVNNERELLDAFEEVCDSNGDAWTIFDYETNSNILKVGSSGTGGLEELLQSFQDSRVQYGFVGFQSEDGKLQKVLLIHWQGDAVPALKLANTASHIEEVKRFVKRVNCTVYARNQDDLDLATIKHKLQQLSTMASPAQQKSTPFIPPTPVGSVYKPVKDDLELSERENFWKSVQAEEEERRREDAKRREDQQKQFQLERKLLEKELHEMHLSAAVRKAQKEAENQPPPATKPKPPPAAPTLVGSRTKMFNQQIEDIAKNTVKTPNKPKQFKFEIPIQPKNQQMPVNSGANEDEDFVPITFEDPSKPVAKVVPQQPLEQQNVEEEEPAILTEKEEGKLEEVKNEKSADLRAITLWDYTASDSTELSFDSNQIITDIKKTDINWYTGRIDDHVGLFPANYVKIL